MKYSLSTMAAIFAALTITSCSNDDIAQQTDNSKAKCPMVFTATQENDDVTSRSSLNESKVEWTANDEVAIWDGTTTNKFTATPESDDPTSATLAGEATEGSSEFSAVYPYSAVELSTSDEIHDIVIPDVQTATEGTFDPAAAVMTATTTSDENNFAFKNACSFLKITTSVAYQKISVSATTGTLSGAFTCSDYANATLSVLSGYGKQVVVLNPLSGSTTIAAGTYYVAIAPGAISGLSVKCYTSASEYYEKTSSASKSFTFVRSKYYDLGSTSNWTKHTTETRGYSVSDTKKVAFTRGNLWYGKKDATSTTEEKAFHLESKQIGSSRDADGYISIDYDHLSYFYWTNVTDYNLTSAYAPFATCYSYGTQTTTDKCWCGVDNPITVDDVSNLYILTNDEWIYLIKYRVNADKLYKYNVIVTDGDDTYTNCLVIAPDNYDFATNPLKDSYTLNEIKNYNLTCLPAVACTYDRNGKKWFYPDELGYGCYWTATPVETDVNVDNAYDFDWSDYDISTETGVAMEMRSFGECIRLVQTYTSATEDFEHFSY